MRAEIRALHRGGCGLVMAGLLLVAGCALWAPEPAFRAALPPERIDGDAAIAIVGDLQITPARVRFFRGREDNRAEQGRLVADLTAQRERLGALVIVGDLVFTPRSARDWKGFDSLVAPLATSMPVLPAVGNHDYHCWFVQLCSQRVTPRELRKRFGWLAPGEPYFVAHGDVALFFLDSETGLERQAVWLGDRLAAAADDYAAAVVFFHRPPFTNSIDLGAEGHVPSVEHIVPVVAQSPLPTIVVNGHVHGYEHLQIEGVDYFTTAGGGGPRGLLGPVRPGDVYAGPDCSVEPDGSVLRPFNYLLLARGAAGIQIEVRGLCRGDPAVSVLESVHVPLPER